MISVVDNFFDPWQLKLAINEVKKIPFYDISDHPRHEQNTNYPGTRTDDLHRVHPLLATFIIQKVSAINAGQFHSQRWDCKMCVHLRTEDDDELDYIHRDTGFDWAFLIYLSESNLKSGTKFYKAENSDKEDDNVFVKFEQNRIGDCSSAEETEMSRSCWTSSRSSCDSGRLSDNCKLAPSMNISDK